MGQRRVLRATIDRIERDERGSPLAVLVFDDDQQLVLPLSALPSAARAKQVVRVSFQIDEGETSRREEDIARLQRELFGDP